MSEFMGLIYGGYDAKSAGEGNAAQESATVPTSAAVPLKEAAGKKKSSSGGFQPGGSSLHCCM